MFETKTPEAVGLASKNIRDFLRYLRDNGVTMHSMLLLRGNCLFGEYYWKPFHRDFCHRMYSQTKSYVGIAIGLLEEEGKLSLDERIADCFPERLERELPEYLKHQTIRHMLTMTTAVSAPYWFHTSEADRVREYLNSSAVHCPSGTLWAYDSPGTQVLSVLAEKRAGMPLLAYLKEKLFCHMDCFHTAEMLKTRNDDTWGDSALLCTGRDMLAFARFVMNGGVWNGKRLMNEAYLKAATSALVNNNENGFATYDSWGYGYQIWCNAMNGFSFIGMGGQFTICVPDKDFIFVCMGDNQGHSGAYDLINAGLKFFIVDPLGEVLPENEAEHRKLVEYTDSLMLAAVTGEKNAVLAEKIDGADYICETNGMGMEWFRFEIAEDTVLWHYKNVQGEKCLRLGLDRNEFTKFPQYGYSQAHGGLRTSDGSLYDCAASCAFGAGDTLTLRVQIIDRYFGNLAAVFAFRDDLCVVRMRSHAEDFLKEYSGELTAHRQS